MIFCKPLIHILTFSYHYHWIIQLGPNKARLMPPCLIQPVLSPLLLEIPTKSVTAVACNVGRLSDFHPRFVFKGDTLDIYFDWCFWQYRETVLFTGRFLLHMTLDQWCGIPSKETVKKKLRMPSTYSSNKAKMERSFPFGLGCSVHRFLWRGESGGAWHSNFFKKTYVTSSNNLIFPSFYKIFSLQRGFARSHGWPALFHSLRLYLLPTVTKWVKPLPQMYP